MVADRLLSSPVAELDQDAGSGSDATLPANESGLWKEGGSSSASIRLTPGQSFRWSRTALSTAARLERRSERPPSVTDRTWVRSH
jgi:hypothetical protein